MVPESRLWGGGPARVSVCERELVCKHSYASACCKLPGATVSALHHCWRWRK